MNIFVTDRNPQIAAKNLCDAHVVKMVLESAQLLCTYLNEQDIQTPYKSTHVNHPCSLWLRKDKENVTWLWVHFISLLDEYKYRYDKTHACNSLIMELIRLGIDDYKWHYTKERFMNPKFVLCMPDQYKTDDPIQSYRNYYMSKQYNMKRPIKWTKREKPAWFIEEINNAS